MSDKSLSFPELDNLTEEQRKVALSILQELAQDGISDTYSNLLKSDYEEIPVDIYTFLTDPKYLGSGLIDSEGRFSVFPFWVETLKDMFPDPLSPGTYNTLALTGSIGIGKSMFAVLCLLYELYRMLCLRDPYLFYQLQPIDKITFALMNITLDASKGVAWDKCQQLLQCSPWFLNHGTLVGRTNIEWVPDKRIELVCGSESRHIIGRAVFACFFDEISFLPNMDVSKQKEKATALVNTAAARMQSRFMKGAKSPTLLILASSKRTEQSYLEEWIANKKKMEAKSTLIVDKPQWIVRTDKDSDQKFTVALGNKFLSSEVIPINSSVELIESYRKRGYTFLDVPIGYYENFLEDIDIALTDIAGISTSSTNRFINGPRLSAITTDKHQNLFVKDIIEVGNAADDLAQYKDFFDLSRVDPALKYKPLYIHYDLSKSGDKTGLAGTWVIGKRPPSADGRPESSDLFYRPAFSVSIKAPKGYDISFEKNLQFIYWLKDNGFNIKAVTSDTFQNVAIGQQLTARGFNYSVLSVDRVESDDSRARICKPYHYFKTTMYEERMSLYKTTLLADEILGLVRDNNNGKIDHTPESGPNSKDQVDALCGSIYRASQDAALFAFDQGENLAVFIESNTSMHSNLANEFEDELKNVFNPLNIERKKETFKDFGMGKAQELPTQYALQGIIIS